MSRLDHGTKYCKQSPTMEEAALQSAIMDAVTEQDRFTEITLELAELKKKQESISAQLRNNQGLQEKVNSFASAAEVLDHQMTEWDEEFIRQMVHTVEVISADRIRVVLTDGTVIMQEVHR